MTEEKENKLPSFEEVFAQVSNDLSTLLIKENSKLKTSSQKDEIVIAAHFPYNNSENSFVKKYKLDRSVDNYTVLVVETNDRVFISTDNPAESASILDIRNTLNYVETAHKKVETYLGKMSSKAPERNGPASYYLITPESYAKAMKSS